MKIPGFTAEASLARGSRFARTHQMWPTTHFGRVVPAQGGLEEICGSCINGRQFCRFYTTRMSCHHVPSSGGSGSSFSAMSTRFASHRDGSPAARRWADSRALRHWVDTTARAPRCRRLLRADPTQPPECGMARSTRGRIEDLVGPGAAHGSPVAAGRFADAPQTVTRRSPRALPAVDLDPPRIHLRSVSESSRLARDRSDRRVLRLVLAAVPWRRPEPEHNLGRDEADEGIRRDLPMIQ